MEIERQTFVYYHVNISRDIKFAGYVANHLDTHKLTFVRQKPTLWINLDTKIKFWHKIFQALKMVAWPFSTHHVDIYKRLNVDYDLSFKLNQKFFRFAEFKICS